MNRRQRKDPLVELDEVMLDSSNVPSFNQSRLEGNLEYPIAPRNIYLIGVLFILITLLFSGRLFSLQVLQGAEYRATSDANRVDEGVLIAERGVLYDRTGELLAWNEYDHNEQYSFPVRAYTDRAGLGHVTGYISYPEQDKTGAFFRTTYVGRAGAEATFNEVLRGQNGTELVEMTAAGNVVGAHAIAEPKPGKPVTLTIDAALSEAMYTIIAEAVADAEFRSGAGAIMNVQTGELLALASFPAYDPEIMADGDELEVIDRYREDARFPFLNKVTRGVYTPGSIVKPFIAYAALREDVVHPSLQIEGGDALVIPNPYTPSAPARFADWRRQGSIDLREAIAFSSNIYFFIIGGGLPEIAVPQAGLREPFTGLGIENIARSMREFGFGKPTGAAFGEEVSGTVPDPEWKRRVFAEAWRLGDTYNTAIGQFGFQVTPLQMVRAYAALANGEGLVTPRLTPTDTPTLKPLPLEREALAVVREGMRMAVNTDGGTARSLERDDVAIAAKSGTAEVGQNNESVNSWAAGYFPYEAPQYSFILLLERAPRENTLGATTVMGRVVEWMAANRPSYLGIHATSSDAHSTTTKEN